MGLLDVEKLYTIDRYPTEKIQLGIDRKIQHVGNLRDDRQRTDEAQTLRGQKIQHGLVVVIAAVEQGDEGASVNQDGSGKWLDRTFFPVIFV
ncbi:hypothetical protein AGMMS49543_24220 [Betaproteobacteria bacterium]|nr:hypothetical protein AGMMS49543_24220 [Betaproteobacteria bacterium]